MTPTIYSELKEGSKISNRRTLFATVTSSVVSTTTKVTANCPTISAALSNNNGKSKKTGIRTTLQCRVVLKKLLEMYTWPALK